MALFHNLSLTACTAQNDGLRQAKNMQLCDTLFFISFTYKTCKLL